MERRMPISDQPAFQDALRDNYCWGCGSLNDDGLHIESRWEGEESVCVWQAHDFYAAGPRHILNGGIIATILDCHSVCTAVADAYREEGREMGTDPDIWYVTGSLHVNYLRPTPLSNPVTLRGRVVEKGERRTTVACSLYSGEDECARSEVVAVRVDPQSWRDGD